jgi:hypothetical protein
MRRAIHLTAALAAAARHRSLQRTELPAEAPRVLQRHCLGAAVAASPAGPFTGLDEPLVCTDFADGVIDAGIFTDGAAHYLYYKDDANCCGRGSAIFVQPLTADGLTPLGRPIRLHSNNDSPGPEDDWEWRVVEAPTMVKRGGAYFLFFSGNFFGNKNYSVGYLRCASPIGPCRDLGDNPILHRPRPPGRAGREWAQPALLPRLEPRAAGRG